MNKIIFILLSLFALSSFLCAGEYTIVDGSSNSYHVPVYGYSHYGWSRFIYTASELSDAGISSNISITRMAFNVQNTVTDYVMDNQKIYFAVTYNSSLSGYTSYPNPGSNASYTKVYDGSISWSGPGWMEIVLDTPFSFTPDGFVGLEIVWENRDGSRASGYPKFYYTSKSNSAVYKESGSTATFPTSAGGTSNNHPSFRIITPATEVPNPATVTSPVSGALDVSISTDLKWASGGGSPNGYFLSLGTDNPPTNILSAHNLNSTNYQPSTRLDYGTSYYWQVTPYNSIGNATSCPIWSFTTLNDPSIAVFPYQESFDTAVPPNSDWQRGGAALSDPINLSGNSLWGSDDWLNIAGTDKAAKINIWGSLNGWLISPLIMVPSDNYYLAFDLAVLKYNQTPAGTPPLDAPDDQIAVLVGDGYSWSTANIVREWNNTGSVYEYRGISVNGDRVVIPLAGHTGRIRIAFFAGSAISNADNDIMINNLLVQEFARPLAAVNPSPVHQATEVAVNQMLSWTSGGGDPNSFKLFLGSSLPETHVLCPLDSYNPGTLDYGTEYLWKVIPTNPAGDATDCPVWSFTTTSSATVDAGTILINEIPVNPSVEIGGLTGEASFTATASYAPEGLGLPNYGLVMQLSSTGTSLSGHSITIHHQLGFVPSQIAYRILPAETYQIINNPGTWTDMEATIVLSAKADGDAEIVFPIDADATLPVELSYFSANFTAELFVQIAWITQSETNHSGYNIMRSLDAEIANAIRINSQLIQSGSQSGSQTSYLFTDKEPVYNSTLYYWLESVALNGETQFIGPMRVATTNPGTEPELPELPNATILFNAFPNPFNPNTNLRYSLKEAGNVRIDIFNTRGQFIRSFSAIHSTGGTFSLAWDGKDSTGMEVSSGLYLYRMQTKNYSATRKMMMLK